MAVSSSKSNQVRPEAYSNYPLYLIDLKSQAEYSKLILLNAYRPASAAYLSAEL